MKAHKRSLTILLSPIGNKCNLKCMYCNTKFLSDNSATKIISEDLLVKIFQQIRELNIAEVQIHWYGGEPLIAGLKFFERALYLEKKILNGIKIYNSLNTNGLLLNQEYLAFFKNNNFVVSVSIDGKNYYQNSYRFKKPTTYELLLKKIDLMRKFNFHIWPQMVVHHKNWCDAIGIYNYFKDMGITALSIFPCFHKKNNNALSELCIGPEEYSAFLIELFDIWIKNKMPFRIPLFINMFSGIMRHSFTFCYISGNCSSMNIDNLGNVYASCNVQTTESYLGNLTHRKMITYYKKFLRKAHKGLKKKELTQIMNADVYNIDRFKKKDNICYWCSVDGTYYFLKAIWNLYKHINKFYKEVLKC